MSILEALFDRSEPTPATPKAATGSGVVAIEQGIPAASLFGNTYEKRALQAIEVWRSNLWVRSCERLISTRLATYDWWLEDEEGEPVTDGSSPALQEVRDLFLSPYRPRDDDPVTATPQTFTALRSITARHVGVVGYSFWYMSEMEALSGTPLEMLYIHPARMTPATNKQGGLIGWVMDKDSENPVGFKTDEIVLFNLEPPDDGFLSNGLVVSAFAKAEMTRLSDKHANYTLSAGGRLPGIFTPPTGASIPEEQFQGIVRDMRSIVEMPDASKRSLVLKGPVEFKPTSVSAADLKLVELADLSRDALLALWGVPKTQLGMDAPVGLNSGEAKGYDEATLHQNAIGPRSHAITETINRLILPRFAEAVGRVTMVVKEPTFDDDTVRYEQAAKAATMPLRNVERRDILGLGPLGDERDNEVWLPVNMVAAFEAPPLDPESVGKAKGLQATQKELDRVRDALGGFLRKQADRIGRLMEKKQAAIKRKPNDPSPYWNDKREDEELEKVLRPFLTDAAMSAAMTARGRVGVGKADDELISWREAILGKSLKNVGKRVKLINKGTLDLIRNMVREALEIGLSPAELGRSLRGIIDPLPDDEYAQELLREGAGTFASELRAETIARTEMRLAQNEASLLSYEDLGVTKVEMSDGDEDEVCEARNGQVVSLDVARQHMTEEHPNGTLAFIPSAASMGKADERWVARAEDFAPTPNRDVTDAKIEPVTVGNAGRIVVELPPQPAPIVNVQPPEVHVDAPSMPVVTVEAPQVKVEPPEVNVESPTVVVTPEITVEQPPAKADDDVQPVFVVNMPKGKNVQRGVDGRINHVENEF